MTDCKFGANCHNYHCKRPHPAGRTQTCHWVTKSPAGCTNDRCSFLHPGKGGGKGKGGGALVKHAGGDGGLTYALKRDARGVRSLQLTASKGGRTERLSIKAGTRTMCFACTVDVSYSMHGETAEAAAQGLEAIVSVLRPTDLYGCSVFDSSVTRLHHPMPRRKVKLEKDLAAVRKADGGSTALYDAIAHSIQALKVTAKGHREGKWGKADSEVVYELLVVTDGADNSSSATLSELVQLVHKPGLPNFNLVLLGVGISGGAAADMRQLCKARHAHFYQCSGVSELKQQLQRARESIRLQLDVSDRRSGQHSSTQWKGARADASKALLGMAKHAPVLMGQAARHKAVGGYMGKLLKASKGSSR